jgi:uncharacterized protein YndB with AHSA1/START domain
MSSSKITVQTTVKEALIKVWDYYTQPKHIIHWNFADPSWHCPSAENDMRVGGTYKARMEAKDGSYGFDFEVIYTDVLEGKGFSYAFGGRNATVVFNDLGDQTEVVVTFDPETENAVEMQRDGWQAILNNFKAYTENN